MFMYRVHVIVRAECNLWLLLRSCAWTAPWSRSSSPCPTSASSSHKSLSCVCITPQSATNRAAKSTTSSCALKTSSMRWTGRRNCEVLKRPPVAQTPCPVRGPSHFLFVLYKVIYTHSPSPGVAQGFLQAKPWPHYTKGVWRGCVKQLKYKFKLFLFKAWAYSHKRNTVHVRESVRARVRQVAESSGSH